MTTSNIPLKPSPLACDICRRRHVKCDGHPTCSRCSRIGLSCTYTPSRRGFNRRKHSIDSQNYSTPRHDSHHDSDATAAPTAALEGSMMLEATERGQSSMISHVITNTTSNCVPCMSLGSAPDDREHLLDVYYTNFHSSHPILVPQALYYLQAYPDHLENVVLHIGKLYAEDTSQQQKPELTQDILFCQLRDRSSDNDGILHLVQALTLLGIVLHAQHRASNAQWCLSTAMRLALDIGLNRPLVASGQSPIIVESLRRTWWELWTTDTYLAALHRRQPSHAGHTYGQPPLPDYSVDQEMVSNAALTLQEMQNSIFQEVRPSFPSAAHRAEALCTIERISALPTHADQDDIQAIDNAIVSWRRNLPKSKAHVMDSAGEVDQMLLQAYCYNYCACIFLHFPRSDLPATVPTTATISGGREYRRFAAASAYHTAKAIVASKELCNLAALPCAPQKHSPLFACALILACIVQLAAASVHLGEGVRQCQQQHFDRVALLIGTIDTLGQRWAVARHAAQRLRPIAALIFATARASAVDRDSLPYVGNDGDFSSMSWLNILDFDTLQDDSFQAT